MKQEGLEKEKQIVKIKLTGTDHGGLYNSIWRLNSVNACTLVGRLFSRALFLLMTDQNTVNLA